MKLHAWLVFPLLPLFAGCESVADATSAVRDRLAARSEGRTKDFPQARRPVYDAVRLAADRMGYRMVRGRMAAGEFEAITGVRPGERSGTSRQLSLKVRLEDGADGGTRLGVKISEILEADSSNRPGQATESPLRDTPQYAVFFDEVERTLRGGSPP